MTNSNYKHTCSACGRRTKASAAWRKHGICTNCFNRRATRRQSHKGQRPR